MFSKNERYKSSNVNSEGPKCSNCNKFGHVVSRCYLRGKIDTRVNQLLIRHENPGGGGGRDITCYNFQGRGHIAKHSRKPKKCVER